MNSINEKLIKNIKKARILHNYTQKDLAKKVGVSISVIKNIETGKNISLNNFLKIIDVLGYSKDFFYILEQNKPTSIEQHQALIHGTYKNKQRIRH